MFTISPANTFKQMGGKKRKIRINWFRFYFNNFKGKIDLTVHIFFIFNARNFPITVYHMVELW